MAQGTPQRNSEQWQFILGATPRIHVNSSTINKLIIVTEAQHFKTSAKVSIEK